MTVHLAGTPIGLDGRVIQRCLICGFKLCDSEGSAAPPEPDGSVPVFPTWEPADWIEVIEGNPTEFSVFGQSEHPQHDASEIPDGCCIDLVE